MTEKARELAPSERSEQSKQLMGIILFIIYSTAYAGFVIISVYDVTLMDTMMPFGLNLATFYGLALIVFALALALFYSKVCKTIEKKAQSSEENSSRPISFPADKREGSNS